MKRFFTIVILLFVGIATIAQNYPSEWAKYTSDGYFHDIESAQYKQDALDLALSNLAKQIQVRVKEVSQIDKQVVNGRSSINYNSQKNFSTDVDMDLVQTLSNYNGNLGKYYVIAYINKEEACNFYENEIKMLISNIDSHIAIADNYINTGFKTKAKEELQNTLALYSQKDKPLFWLNVFGLNDNMIQLYLNKINNNEQTIKSKLADLEYGVTYCVICTADNFGKNYSKLQNEIKGDLSTSGCNFVDDPNQADYVIYIDASSREYNQVNTSGGNAYFVYVDAVISIDKKATGQRVFEDEITVKGSHTMNYIEAGRDGYKKIRKEISEMLKENIKL